MVGAEKIRDGRSTKRAKKRFQMDAVIREAPT
jgi:hypothetical protein